MRTKSIIICSIHGELLQLATNHLVGNRYQKCALLRRGNSIILVKNHQLSYYNIIRPFQMVAIVILKFTINSVMNNTEY